MFGQFLLILARARLVRDFAGVSGLHRSLRDHSVDLLRLDAACEVLVDAEGAVLSRGEDGVPRPLRLAEELHRLLCVDGEDRFQVDGQDSERVERGGERRARRLGVRLHGLPRFAAVEVFVRGVRKAADLDDDLVEAAVLVELRDRLGGGAALLDKRAALLVERPEAALEPLLEHLPAARGDVRDLADEVGVHPLDEVREVEVHVVRRPAQLSRVVVAKRRGGEVLEIRAGVHERALRLGHLLAVHGEEAVDEYLVRLREAGDVEHPRPEEAVEAYDVLADEVVALGLRVLPPVLEALAVRRAPVLERGEVSDGGVHPDVEVLVVSPWDLEAEVRG